MGHPVDDMIAAAGNLLLQQWKNPGHQIPSADLHPRPDALRFEIQVLAGRLAETEKKLDDLITALRRNNGR